MTAFKGNRVIHEFTQNNCAAPEEVFPLLCPVREADWLPGWRFQLIYSDSGVAELGCIFTTPNSPVNPTEAASEQKPGGASESTWMVVDYDPGAFRIAYVWINPGMIATDLRIRLARVGGDMTQTHIRYRYTGLSPEGNHEIESYNRQWFEKRMRGWETAINHYLKTGKMIGTDAVK